MGQWPQITAHEVRSGHWEKHQENITAHHPKWQKFLHLASQYCREQKYEQYLSVALSSAQGLFFHRTLPCSLASLYLNCIEIKIGKKLYFTQRRTGFKTV